MRYRLYSIVLSAALVCGSLLLSLERWTAAELKGFSYVVSGNTVQICSYTGDAEIVSIPDTIDEKTVTEILPRAFYENPHIRSVELPFHLRRIGEYAFYNCAQLERITLPDSLVEIGQYAFSQCGMLSCVTIPKKVSVIREGAFSGMNSLQKAVIYANCRIGEAVFADCPVLQSVSFLGIIHEIEREAFFNDPMLKSVNLPASVSAIGERAFGYVCGQTIGTYTKAVNFVLLSESAQVHRYVEENGF